MSNPDDTLWSFDPIQDQQDRDEAAIEEAIAEAVLDSLTLAELEAL